MPKPPLKSNPTAQKPFRQHLRKHGTVAEAVLCRILKDRQIVGVKFRRQFGVSNYVLDFYAPDLKLAIELDGVGHYTLEGDAYDVTRTQLLFHDYGIRILRFENREVLQELQRVIHEITEVVKQIQRGEEFVCRSWRWFQEIIMSKYISHGALPLFIGGGDRSAVRGCESSE